MLLLFKGDRAINSEAADTNNPKGRMIEEIHEQTI